MSKIPTDLLCPKCQKYKLKESDGAKFCDNMHCDYIENIRNIFARRNFKKKNDN